MKMTKMADMTPEEVQKQHELTQELYTKVRDAVGEYVNTLLPVHIYGVLGSVTEAFSHWNANKTLNAMKEESLKEEGKEDGFAA